MEQEFRGKSMADVERMIQAETARLQQGAGVQEEPEPMDEIDLEIHNEQTRQAAMDEYEAAQEAHSLAGNAGSFPDQETWELLREGTARQNKAGSLLAREQAMVETHIDPEFLAECYKAQQSGEVEFDAETEAAFVEEPNPIVARLHATANTPGVMRRVIARHGSDYFARNFNKLVELSENRSAAWDAARPDRLPPLQRSQAKKDDIDMAKIEPSEFFEALGAFMRKNPKINVSQLAQKDYKQAIRELRASKRR